VVYVAIRLKLDDYPLWIELLFVIKAIVVRLPVCWDHIVGSAEIGHDFYHHQPAVDAILKNSLLFPGNDLDVSCCQLFLTWNVDGICPKGINGRQK
jgi:hypothetical protein